jgi:hypothetical protein
LMVEGVLLFNELTGDFDEVSGDGSTTRVTSFTLSPGARGGWNLGDQQLVLGIAVPVTWVEGSAEGGVLVYLSYELPFKK